MHGPTCIVWTNPTPCSLQLTATAGAGAAKVVLQNLDAAAVDLKHARRKNPKSTFFFGRIAKIVITLSLFTFRG
jgi:hypothetical protein